MGWSAHAPFDAIIVSATATKIPQALLDQLKKFGKMVITVQNNDREELCLITKKTSKYEKIILDLVRFVPLKSGTSDSND